MRYTFALTGLAVMVAAAPMKMHIDTTTPSSDAINIPTTHDLNERRSPPAQYETYGPYDKYENYVAYPRALEKKNGVEGEASPAHHPVIKDTRDEHGPVMKSTTSTSKAHEMKRSVDHSDATEVSAAARSSGKPLPYNWYGKYDPYANYGEYEGAEKQAEGAGAGLMDA